MKSITITAKNDQALAAKMIAEGRRIQIQAAGGNWKLDRTMKAKGLSDQALARLIGATPQAVYYWRKGKRNPIWPFQLKIAVHLGTADLGFRIDKLKRVKMGFVARGNRDGQFVQDPENAAAVAAKA